MLIAGALQYWLKREIMYMHLDILKYTTRDRIDGLNWLHT